MITDPASWLLPALVALGVAGLTAPLRHWLLGRRLLDLPGERRSHLAPTPRGGGLAILAALGVAWLAWPGAISDWYLPMLFVLALGLLGWLEDRRGLPARLRLLAQLVAGAWLLFGVGGIASVAVLGHEIEAVWVWSALGLVAAVWLVNLHNFMDGSDGLAALQGLWAGLVFAGLFHAAGEVGLAHFALAVAGGWGGFLVWNRPPAGIFMGDVGSLALGAAVAACAVVGAAGGSVSIWAAFMVASVFVVDATATLLRRVMRGERWYTAHRQHAYQRLLDLGWGHGHVLALYGSINVGLVLPCILAARHWPRWETVLAVVLAVVLAGGWWMVQSSAANVTNDKARV